eukprot:12411703-Karenia_brevis.AAC.1
MAMMMMTTMAMIATATMMMMVMRMAKQQEKLQTLASGDDTTSNLFLVWLVVVQLIMPLHYRLFKRGTFYNRIQARPQQDQRFACFEFCSGTSKNPAAKLLCTITDMLLDPMTAGREALQLIFWKFGSELTDWPLVLLASLHISLTLSFARVWRLMVWHFKQYPWLLAPGFDPSLPEDKRIECLKKFIALPRGSAKLDPGLGRKLRDL